MGTGALAGKARQSLRHRPGAQPRIRRSRERDFTPAWQSLSSGQEVLMPEKKNEPLAQVKRKLVESKERWAREGRLLTGRPARPAKERLPPGQHRVKNWPVLDLGVQPDVTTDGWRLMIDGVVETPVTWDWTAFRAQPAFRDV